MPVVSITRLLVRSWRFLPAFIVAALRIVRQAQNAEGNLGAKIFRDRGFPFDFGSFPDTKSQDGDPLDVLILNDEPTFAGCQIDCRLIGTIKGKQTE